MCGWVGRADPAVDWMFDAIVYRGDATDREVTPKAEIGYRWWTGRPGKSPGLHRAGEGIAACAGTFVPAITSPASKLPRVLGGGRASEAALRTLDGAFAGGWWDAGQRRLSLIRDPFGVRSLYYAEHTGVFYFASELKQLLQIPGLPIVNRRGRSWRLWRALGVVGLGQGSWRRSPSRLARARSDSSKVWPWRLQMRPVPRGLVLECRPVSS